MVLSGTVHGGVVVLENGVTLADGTKVRIEVPEPTSVERTIADELLEWAGHGEGLPNDLAVNHDHYLHGLPKQ